jgi:hypothetical protein
VKFVFAAGPLIDEIDAPPDPLGEPKDEGLING